MPEKSRRFRKVLGSALALVAGAAFIPSALPSAAAEDSAVAAPAVAAQPYIVGGADASVADYPYAVFLADARGNQFCGGVLIGPSSVATAAHCAKAVARADMKVVAGRQDKRTRSGSQADVSSVWMPSTFSEPTKGQDIAVLTLRTRLPYKAVTVAGGGDTALYREGTKATVLGWGRMSDGGQQSNTLRKAVVPLISDKSCAASYSNYDPGSMVCAGYSRGGVDACQGDSGGPLVVGDTLIGIVSYGEGCAEPNRPGVYTRVSAYADEMGKHARSD
jgi:secreted trypsin-like serine protease